jgi:glycosyltransferase involved in cell wall biosynthesis
MRILHAIHDFLPRHRAGSEIYAFELARELSASADVFILAAEYDPGVPHGTIRWRPYQGIPVAEIVNNWQFGHFRETYSSERINAQLRHVLDATQPDVLHVHNLLNLSFDLPRIAKERGIATVATLHDYTLVCPSGGQRVHVAESHVCESIDPERCARCFSQSPLSSQMGAARLTGGVASRAIARAGRAVFHLAPALAATLIKPLNAPGIAAGDIRRRLAAARQVFESIDLCVAPSRSVADEFCRLGFSRDRLHVSDYGFRGSAQPVRRVRAQDQPLRIGFVGTLVWHKGVHVLLEAARQLRGAFDVHIYGDPDVFPQYFATLRTAAGPQVVFKGAFDRERVDDVYGTLDVLVVSSLWPENSPLVIHEAFMHHVPVVAARVGGIPELVLDGESGLLYDAFDAESLRASLQRLIDDRVLLERLSDHSPAVKSIAQDAREWQERYRTLLTSRRPEVCAWT